MPVTTPSTTALLELFPEILVKAEERLSAQRFYLLVDRQNLNALDADQAAAQ
jgi:hypothetical protein